MGRQLSPRPRQGARRRRDREAPALLALSRRRRRRHRRAHTAGRASDAAATSRAAPGTTSTRRTPKTRPTIRKSSIVWREARDGSERRARSEMHLHERQRRLGADRNRLARRLPLGRARGGRSPSRRGPSVDYMRVRAFPFPASVRAFIESHERCYVVEQNRDGQLRSLLAIETGLARDRMSSILDYGGLPLTADRVVNGVMDGEQARGLARVRTSVAASRGTSVDILPAPSCARTSYQNYHDFDHETARSPPVAPQERARPHEA